MRRYFILLCAFCACLLVACDTPEESLNQPKKPTLRLSVITPLPEVTPTPTVEPTPTSTPAPPPTIALDTKEVERQLAQVEADTAKMRGLKPKSKVPEHFISREEMRYSMMQQTLQEYTPEMAARDATRLWLLLMIDDRSTDFRQMEIDFAGESVLGYYDHEKKELFVRTDGTSLSPGAKETLAHEFVHSLQDQHHDLQKLLPREMDSDQAMAIRSLVEGDATVSGLLYASRYMTMGEFYQMYDESSGGAPPVPGRAPVYLQEGWQFPYKFGSRFVLALSDPGNYKPIDKAFTDPPRSTEQIMHPDKYLSTPRDDPKPVTLPPLNDALGVGWNALETDTLGEFDLHVMLLENYQRTFEAAEGWGGALYTLYSNGKDYVTIMGSRWDTTRDANEWEEALTQSFKLFNKKDGLWMDRGRAWGLKRSGDQIMFVSGTNTAAIQRAMAAIQP
ncbi:MAG TPA: hypothetical protein VJ183_19490 [Chloroflexia bacterium]|nr:hypothetical protein [Chloroflexia bacterium]